MADKITEEQAYQYANSPSDLKLLFTLSQVYEKKIYGDSKEEDLLLKDN